MNRRSFLRRIGAILGAGAAAPVVLEASESDTANPLLGKGWWGLDEGRRTFRTPLPEVGPHTRRSRGGVILPPYILIGPYETAPVLSLVLFDGDGWRASEGANGEDSPWIYWDGANVPPEWRRGIEFARRVGSRVWGLQIASSAEEERLMEEEFRCWEARHDERQRQRDERVARR